MIVILLRVTVRLDQWQGSVEHTSHSTTPEPLVGVWRAFKHTSVVEVTDSDVIYVVLVEAVFRMGY